jgi:hypothetical protein
MEREGSLTLKTRAITLRTFPSNTGSFNPNAIEAIAPAV